MSTSEIGQYKVELIERKESRLLGREYLKVLVRDAAGKLTRREAINLLASTLGLAQENIFLLNLDCQTGSRDVLAEFHVYKNKEAKVLFPRYLLERMLSKEEREKLKQERKKQKTQTTGAKK